MKLKYLVTTETLTYFQVRTVADLITDRPFIIVPEARYMIYLTVLKLFCPVGT